MTSLDEKFSQSYNLRPGQRRAILVVCFLLYMVNYMDRQVLSVVMEPMKNDLGLTDTQAGLLQTCFFLSMALMAFPAAYLVDRWSRRKALALMAVIWSVFTYLTGLGRGFWGVLLPRTLVGIGEAGFAPGGTAMISAAYPQTSRSRVLGLFNAAIPLGSALGTIFGGMIAAKFGGWRWPFYMFAVPGVILGIVTLFLKDYKTVTEVDKFGKKKGFGGSLGGLLKIKTLRYLYLGYAMQLAMTMAFIVWAPAFLMRTQGLPVDRAGLVVGAIGLLGILGAPLGGIMADFWQKRHPKGRVFTALTAVCCAALTLALAVYYEFWGIGLFFGAFWGVFCVAGIPAVNAISQDVVSPAVRGLAWGLAGFVAMLGGAAWAPSAVGAISDAVGGGAPGLKFGLQLMALCGVAAAVLFWLASRHYPDDMARVRAQALEADN